ncbi:MAG: DUF6125 family protein [Syntrophobacterales bacterium]|jgi:hypothetical protein|nr:DUF6125 family protein [Syntrophobacterales bacterium]
MNTLQFDNEQLWLYVEFMLNTFRRVDGFWFLGVEHTYGYDAAIRMNEEVWHRMGKIMTREIKEKFSIEEKGLKAVAKVLRYSPWSLISGFDIEEKDEEVILSAPHCSSQEARLKKGVGEYDCKDMHLGEFESIVKEVDSNVQVECIFAPPDPHPEKLFCKWRFTMSGSKKDVSKNLTQNSAQ